LPEALAIPEGDVGVILTAAAELNKHSDPADEETTYIISED
jgi:hypothetical protein